MSGGVSAYSPPLSSRITPSKNTRNPTRLCNSALLRSSSTTTSTTAPASRDRLPTLRSNSVRELKHIIRSSGFRCNSSSSPGDPGGESDSKRVLDAFFLGKALAEAINERIESTVGEFLSTVGTLQAEQQKQIQDFQEEVLEKSKRAKEKAAREAMETQGLVSKSPTSNITTFSEGSVTTKAAPLSTEQKSVPPSSSNSSTLTASKDENSTDSDPLVGIQIDD